MAGNLVISQINGGPIGVINAIINGNYQINQRGVSGTVTLTAGNYGHDRWKAGSGGCVYTFATANNVTTLTITAGTLVQVIEGSNLYSGTYALSFTGTAQGKIGAGSFSGSGVTGTAVGGTNLNIEFNTGTVSLVQFEPGSEVSPFERRDIGRELALCQRYFFTLRASNVGSNGSYFVGTNRGTSLQGHIAVPVTMRASASLTSSAGSTFYNQNGVNNLDLTTPCTLGTTNQGASIYIVSGAYSAYTQTSAGQIIDKDNTSFLNFSAEL